MSLKEDVENALREQDAEVTIEELDVGSVEIRGGPPIPASFLHGDQGLTPQLNRELNRCARLLEDAGFRVHRLQDNGLPHLRVSRS